MKKRFIILIDFSAYSTNLLKYAYDWSRHINAELLLLHQTIVVAPALADYESKASITQITNIEALKKLKNLAREILPPGAKAQYNVSEVHLQLSLPKLLSEPFEHLVFVGLKGTGLLKKLFIGSTALQVIEHTNNIVVAMPKEIDKFNPEKIFVAVSGKHPFNIIALDNFLGFVEASARDITFFYLAQPNEDKSDIEKQLASLAQLCSGRFNTQYRIYEGSSIKDVINNTVDELLVVQKGSRLFADHLFRKFMINELVYEGQTPMIVLP